MGEPTGKLLFAYDTIRSLEEQALDLKALLLNEEGRILTLTAERDALRKAAHVVVGWNRSLALRSPTLGKAVDKLAALLPTVAGG